MIVLRNLPVQWWIVGLAAYTFRLSFTRNAGVSLVGFYVQRLGWEWLYWQDAVIALLMAALTWLGTPHEGVNRRLLANADWGGMLLLGAGLALIYVGLDQGDRLDWFKSGTVTCLIVGGAALVVGFLVDEAVVVDPWASPDSAHVAKHHLGADGAHNVHDYEPVQHHAGAELPDDRRSVPTRAGRQRLAHLHGAAADRRSACCNLSATPDRRPDRDYPRVHELRDRELDGDAHHARVGVWRLRSDRAGAVYSARASPSPGSWSSRCQTQTPRGATAFVAYIQVMRLDVVEFTATAMTTWLRVREQVRSDLIGLHLSAGDTEMAQTFKSPDRPICRHGAAAEIRFGPRHGRRGVDRAA